MNQKSCVPPTEAVPKTATQSLSFSPRIEINASQDGEVLYVELPGVKRENLELTIEDEVLVLRGTVAQDDEAKRWIRREYGVGSFERRFRLGSELDTDALRAKLENGVLALSLPRKADSQPKRIEINAN